MVLRTYTNERLTVRGRILLPVVYGSQRVSLPMVVVDGSGPTLFGRDWMSEITLHWSSIKQLQVENGLPEMKKPLSEFGEVFREELGTIRPIKAHLTVKTGVQPRFFKPRSVPFSLKSALEAELSRLESMGVLEPVEYSEWAAPVVPVAKKDGGIILCGDFKVTVNQVLDIDQYPVPKPDELFACLTGGQRSTKLDLAHAYNQLILDEESRKFVTINTHKGLYRYT